MEGDHVLRFEGGWFSVLWPAVLKVIHDYGLLLHFMSTSDKTSNVFQVTMRCLEDVLRFMLHLTSRLHCRG